MQKDDNLTKAEKHLHEANQFIHDVRTPIKVIETHIIFTKHIIAKETDQQTKERLLDRLNKIEQAKLELEQVIENWY